MRSQDANVSPLAAEPSFLTTAVLLSSELQPGGTGAVSQPSALQGLLLVAWQYHVLPLLLTLTPTSYRRLTVCVGH